MNVLDYFPISELKVAGNCLQDAGNRLLWAGKNYESAWKNRTPDILWEVESSILQLRVAIEKYVVGLAILHGIEIPANSSSAIRKALNKMFPQGSEVLSTGLLWWEYVPPLADITALMTKAGFSSEARLMVIPANLRQVTRSELLDIYARCGDCIHSANTKHTRKERISPLVEPSAFWPAHERLMTLIESQLIPIEAKDIMILYHRDRIAAQAKLIAHRTCEVALIQSSNFTNEDTLSDFIRDCQERSSSFKAVRMAPQ